jgi:hypothetical protein
VLLSGRPRTVVGCLVGRGWPSGRRGLVPRGWLPLGLAGPAVPVRLPGCGRSGGSSPAAGPLASAGHACPSPRPVAERTIPLLRSASSALSLAACFRARPCGARTKTKASVQATGETRSRCWGRRRHAASGVSLTPRSARPARAGTCRRRCREVCARRSVRVWPVRGPGGTGPSPVLPRRSPSPTWPPGPGRGGRRLRERLCSTEVTTPYPTKPSAANTAIRARKSIRGAKE